MDVMVGSLSASALTGRAMNVAELRNRKSMEMRMRFVIYELSWLRCGRDTSRVEWVQWKAWKNR